MGTQQVQQILSEMVSKNFLDSQVANLLVDNIDEVRKNVAERQAQAHRFYHYGIERSEIVE